jgi:hypothetical protein
MSWITPKTNWARSDYFNSNPDYERIKGNIEYLSIIGQELYGSFSITAMVEPTYNADGVCTLIPTSSFFNNIVNNINTIRDNTISPVGYKSMRTYAYDDYIWDYKELNIIENNIKLLYNVLQGQINILEQLPFNLESDGI